MNEQQDKKRGSLAGGAAGLAVGVWIATVLLVLTSTSIGLILLIAPIVTAAAGATLGEKVAFFRRRHVAVIAASLVVLVAGAVLPVKAQEYRFDRLREDTVPAYPGAELLGLDKRIVGTKEVPGFALRYRVDASPQEVMAFLKVELESNGWKEIFPVEAGNDLLFRFERPGYMIHVGTDPIASEYVIMCSAFNLYHRRKAMQLTPPM